MQKNENKNGKIGEKAIHLTPFHDSVVKGANPQKTPFFSNYMYV